MLRSLVRFLAAKAISTSDPLAENFLSLGKFLSETTSSVRLSHYCFLFLHDTTYRQTSPIFYSPTIWHVGTARILKLFHNVAILLATGSHKSNRRFLALYCTLLSPQEAINGTLLHCISHCTPYRSPATCSAKPRGPTTRIQLLCYLALHFLVSSPGARRLPTGRPSNRLGGNPPIGSHRQTYEGGSDPQPW